MSIHQVFITVHLCFVLLLKKIEFIVCLKHLKVLD